MGLHFFDLWTFLLEEWSFSCWNSWDKPFDYNKFNNYYRLECLPSGCSSSIWLLFSIAVNSSFFRIDFVPAKEEFTLDCLKVFLWDFCNYPWEELILGLWSLFSGFVNFVGEYIRSSNYCLVINRRSMVIVPILASWES